MTLVDWMFAHPWMTFLVALVLADSVSIRSVVVRVMQIAAPRAKELPTGLALKEDP